MRKTISLLCLAALWIAALPAAGEEPANNLKSIHDKLAADKRAIVGQYMDLSDAEAKAFWPVYDQYQADLGKIQQRMVALLESYAADYNAKSLTDEKAQKLLADWIAIDQDEIKHRKEYAPQILKVLPAPKAARYLQIENEYRAVVRYDLATTVPLAE